MASGLDLGPTTPVPNLANLTPEERVTAMVDWFSANFEDPAEETPYNSREGGYQYIWGGPYEARDELGDAFDGVATDEEIESAIEEIESGGIVDWAPHGSRIQPDGPDEDDASYVSGTPEEQVERAVDELAIVLAKYRAERPHIGHNNPPTAIDEVTPVELAAVEQGISEIKLELASSKPNIPKIQRIKELFVWIKAKIAWIAGGVAFAVGDKIRDAVSEKFYAKLEPLLGQAVDALGTWITSLFGF